MPPTDGRALPLARLSIYEPGQGDPIVTDHGYGSAFQVLKETAGQGWGGISLQSGEPTLHYIEDVGLVCRPFLVLQDTRLGHYTTSGGGWEEERPATGAPRKYRLVQYDAGPSVQWSATSAFPVPADPDLAIEFVVPDTNTANDSTTYPPYVRFELGAGAWALEFSKVYGGRLLKKIAGAWVAVSELPEPQTFGNSDNQSVLLLFRCLRGGFAISTDRGRNYLLYREAGTRLNVLMGSWVIRGQGGAVVVGLHQLRYYTGVYTAPAWNTFTSRTSPTVSVTAPNGASGETFCKYEPGAATVVLADTGTHASQRAQFTATLTPSSVNMGTPGWAVYRTPELYAVRYEIATRTALYGYSYSQPLADKAMRFTVTKPLELAEGSMEGEFWFAPNTQFTFAYGRYPKAVLELGHVDDDGVENWTTAFVGRIRQPQCSVESYGETRVKLSADNLAIALKRAKWSNLNRLPLGGQTVNAAVLSILASEAMNHLWPVENRHVAGNLPLPAGAPEDPFEWPPAGESKWETLARILGYVGLELVPLDSGLFLALPQNFIQPFVSETFEPTPTDDLLKLIQRLSYGYDSQESVTAIEVTGTSQYGEKLLAWMVDGQAEGNPLSGKFCPFRDAIVEEVGGTTTPGLLAARAQALAQEHFPLKQEADLLHPVNLSRARRDQVTINWAMCGVNTTDRFVVLSHTLNYNNDPSMETCKSTAGLRRVL